MVMVCNEGEPGISTTLEEVGFWTDTKYMRPPLSVLTDWNLFPKRVSFASRRISHVVFFSHWNTAQCESGWLPILMTR